MKAASVEQELRDPVMASSRCSSGGGRAIWLLTLALGLWASESWAHPADRRDAERASAEEEVRSVVTAFFTAFNKHDVDAIRALYSDDVVANSPDFPEPRRGREAVVEGYIGLFQMSPDVRDDLILMVAEGNTVVVHFVSTGTIAAQAPGLPEHSFGREFRLEIVSILEVRDAKIVKDITLFDQMSFGLQVGLVDAP